MLVEAVVCPATPLLVPAVAAGAASDVDAARAASLAAVRRLLSAGLEALVVLVPGPMAQWRPAATSFARLGMDDPPTDDRPLALHVARWLLEEAGWPGDDALTTSWWSVGDGDVPRVPDVTRLGALVLGDGSARHSERAPGYAHPDAADYDDRAFAALGAADLAALRALDPADDERLLVLGRPAWAVLAGLAEGGDWTAELVHADAPLGVGYAVAGWHRAA